LRRSNILAGAFGGNQDAALAGGDRGGVRRGGSFGDDSGGGVQRVHRHAFSTNTKQKLPVGSIVEGLQGSLKETTVFGSNVRVPVMLLRSRVANPEELLLEL